MCWCVAGLRWGVLMGCAAVLCWGVLSGCFAGLCWGALLGCVTGLCSDAHVFAAAREYYKITVSMTKQAYWVEGPECKEKNMRNLTWKKMKGPQQVHRVKISFGVMLSFWTSV